MREVLRRNSARSGPASVAMKTLLVAVCLVAIGAVSLQEVPGHVRSAHRRADPLVRPVEAREPAPQAAATAPVREVILATQRDHALHIFDAATLESLGRFALHNLAHQVSARADGRMLFLAQAATPDGNGCCALFALDLGTRAMCRLIEPAPVGVSSPDGRRLFVQRGNTGVDVFDARTLDRLPTIAAPGVYTLYPSPDSRWLFGITYWQGPSLDLVDVERGALVRRLPVAAVAPGEPLPGVGGAWVGKTFYLYVFESGQAYLVPVTPETATLERRTTLTVALDLPPGELPSHAGVVASGGRLVVYQGLAWWSKFNPREQQTGVVHGGIFVLEPGTATVTAHLAPSIDFAQVIAAADGQRLYALDAGQPREGRPVRLLSLDAATGTVLAERALEEDVWSIETAALPEALVPRGEVQPAPGPRTEPPPFSPALTPRVAPPAAAP